MKQTDAMVAGDSIGPSEFLISAGNSWFAGIVRGQFGVFWGTPAQPLGISIIHCVGCDSVAIDSSGEMVAYANGVRAWGTGTAGEQSYVILQDDGNLCIYAGADPQHQGAYRWGSKQCGAQTTGLPAFPPAQAPGYPAGDCLFAYDSLKEGQFIRSLSGTFFTGISAGEFGVFAGTPEKPLGTSIILSDACQSVSLSADGRLMAWATPDGTDSVWSSSAQGTQLSYARIQDDGNLCIYVGAQPKYQAALLWGSMQCGARSSNFLPFPMVATTTVTVKDHALGVVWVQVVLPNGTSDYVQCYGPEPQSSTPGEASVTVTARAGLSCCMRVKDAFGGTHDSGDNFLIGESNVEYSLVDPINPFQGHLNWNRVS